MTPDIFAEWLRRRGQRVIRTANSYWVESGPRVFQAFPYHWIIEPAEEELLDFFRAQKAIGGRYSTPITTAEGCVSYHASYEAATYDFEDLSKWARKNTKRGLTRCSVEPISFDRLSDEGWELQHDTLNRQGRKLKFTKVDWQKICITARDLPGFEAWGALVGKQLAASVITFQMDNCCYMLYQQCHHLFLTDHVNNALSYCVTHTMIQRPSIKSILYGLHSLDAPASVDEFKFRMGYTARPVRQRVVFHPLVAPIANPLAQAGLKAVQKLFPGSAALAKAEGMLRFYLQGRRPLAEQDWPESMLDQKEAILAQINRV